MIINIKFRRDVHMLNPFDSAYHDLCNDILEIGNQRDDRTHTGTISNLDIKSASI